MPDAAPDPADEMAALREKAEKFGPGYAAMSEVLNGRSVNAVVGAVKIFIAAAALFVVGAAVWASL